MRDGPEVAEWTAEEGSRATHPECHQWHCHGKQSGSLPLPTHCRGWSQWVTAGPLEGANNLVPLAASYPRRRPRATHGLLRWSLRLIDTTVSLLFPQVCGFHLGNLKRSKQCTYFFIKNGPLVKPRKKSHIFDLMRMVAKVL